MAPAEPSVATVTASLPRASRAVRRQSPPALQALDDAAGRCEPVPQSARPSTAVAVTLAVNNAWRYNRRVLQSFRDKDTERVWQRQRLRKLDESTQRMALRKLLILDAADALADLRVPPGNRLEKLRGDRADKYSIRVNRQWRIRFRWTGAGPEDVEIVDYH